MVNFPTIWLDKEGALDFLQLPNARSTVMVIVIAIRDRDIVDSANKILAYTDGYSFEQFLADGKTVDAVIRNFEIIGEAAVHDYMGIDYNIVWMIK